jgi:hypothetical protein
LAEAALVVVDHMEQVVRVVHQPYQVLVFHLLRLVVQVVQVVAIVARVLMVSVLMVQIMPLRPEFKQEGLQLMVERMVEMAGLQKTQQGQQAKTEK